MVVNLASEEYFKSVKPKKLLECRTDKPVFLMRKNAKFKVVFLRQKARTDESRFIIENRLTKPEQLGHV